MVTKSRIEWTSSTWNPITGCTPVSPGCEHCYAERMAKRLKAMGVHKYRNGFKPTVHPKVIEEPFSWRKPRLVFVNSMSDMFHQKIPPRYVHRIFEVMAACPQHIFQILTKRSKPLARMSRNLPWRDNIWMYSTVTFGIGFILLLIDKLLSSFIFIFI